jgi:hypothetical protein
LAYLEDGNPQRAAKEFQRVIDHRAILPNSLYVVLSQLELGHSYQLAGDHENAKRVLDDLTQVWKNADPDFPPLKQLQYDERSPAARH